MSQDIKPVVGDLPQVADDLTFHVASLWASVLPSIQTKISSLSQNAGTVQKQQQLEELLRKFVAVSGFKGEDDLYSDQFGVSFEAHLEDLNKARLIREEEFKMMEDTLLYMERALLDSFSWISRLEGSLRNLGNVTGFELPSKLSDLPLDNIEAHLTAKLQSEGELRAGWERAQILFGGSIQGQPPPPPPELPPLASPQEKETVPSNSKVADLAPPPGNMGITAASASQVAPVSGPFKKRRILKAVRCQPPRGPVASSPPPESGSTLSAKADSDLTEKKGHSGVKYVVKSLFKFYPTKVRHVALNKLSCTCGLKFKYNSHLLNHIVQRTTEWKYHCSQCNYYFFFQSTLERHTCYAGPNRIGRPPKKATLEVPKSGVNESRDRNYHGGKTVGRAPCGVLSRNPQDWKFPCGEDSCTQRFEYLSELKWHFAKIHKKKDPFKEFLQGCRYCGHMFKTKSEMVQHRQEFRRHRRQQKEGSSSTRDSAQFIPEGAIPNSSPSTSSRITPAGASVSDTSSMDLSSCGE